MTFRKAALALALASALPVNAASDMNITASDNIYWLSGPPFLVLDGGIHFILQEDGNFVVFDNDQNYLWNSFYHTDCSNARCSLQFRADGNLAAGDYGVNPPNIYWVTGTESGAYPAATKLSFRNQEPYVVLYDAQGYAQYITFDTNRHIGGIHDAYWCCET